MAKVFFEDKFMKYQKVLLLRNTLNNILYNEFIAGRTAYEHNFMLIGIFMQIIVFYITGDSVISLISGISGIISVVLCSQKKFSFYIFGFIQLGTYMFLAYQQRFYGELVENIFYIVTMFIGMYIWLKNFNKKEQIVKTKKLSYMQSINEKLGVMDTTAITLCMENKIPILVFALNEDNSIKRAVKGEKIGTIVS